jgi:hypothetical protein
MLKSAARKALWVIKGMALFGGAVVTLALVFGVASVAFGDDGDNFVLGQNNVATALTKLTANRDGVAMQVKNTNPGLNDPALNLTVDPGEAPMRVNSDGLVANLNADKLDGESADQIGVLILSHANDDSPFDSDSPKTATAECPGSKEVVGTGYDLGGVATGTPPNQQTDVVVTSVIPLENTDSVYVSAIEEVPTSRDWSIRATAICATIP